MNTRIFKLALVFVITLNFSCNKNEATLSEFKYANQPETVTCKTGYDDILKEALYTFENDIINKYDPKGKNKVRSYRTYISNALLDRQDLPNTISAHTKEVFDVLKSKPDLFNGNTLNYNSDIAKCIGTNMKDKGLQTTYNALLQTNSMSSKLFGAPLRTSTAYTRDNYLATFIALDLFYAKLNGVDFTTVNFEANEPKAQPIDFNKTPAKTPVKAQTIQPKKEIDHTEHNHD